MPLIIYSQSPEPIVYYFFTTVLQIYYLRKMLERAGPDLAPGSIIREVQVFSWIALLCFLLNYMSLLISFIVVGYYALFIAGLTKRYNIRRLMLVTREALIDFIPLGILAYLRLQSGDHRVVYYVRGMSGLGRLSYQALTYNLNFAYTPGFYKPLGLNPAVGPFILIFLLGAGYFLISRKKHRIPAAFAGLVFACFIYFEVVPWGAVRHTLVAAPLICIFSGFGIEALRRLNQRLKLSRGFFKFEVAILTGIVIFIFIISGSRVYAMRKSRLKLREVVRRAVDHHVKRIVGYRETVVILALLDFSEGNLLEKHGLRLEKFNPGVNDSLTGKYLLVTYRNAFNPAFDRAVQWNAAITPEDFRGVRVTPLEETVGPLEPRKDIMAHQSIYYPINGSFIYLIEPRGVPSRDKRRE